MSSKFNKVFSKVFKLKYFLVLFTLLVIIFAIYSAIDTKYNFWGGEKDLYYRVYENLSSGKIPFIDFFIEYPPLAAYIITLPFVFIKGLSLGWFAALYVIYVGIWTLFFIFIEIKLLKRLGVEIKEVKKLLIVFIGILFLSIELVFARFDIFPATFTVLALTFYLLYKKEKKIINLILSILILAVATNIKLYPVLIFPLIILIEFFDKKFLNLFISILIFILVSCVNIPYFLFGRQNFENFLQYQTQRDIQIESSYASVLLLGNELNVIPANINFQYSALEINDNYAKNFGKFTFAIMAISILTSYALFIILLRKNEIPHQVRDDKKSVIASPSNRTILQKAESTSVFNANKKYGLLILFSIISITSFVFFNKVFSPQYLLWTFCFLPMIAFLQDEKFSKNFWIISLIIIILTFAIFPTSYRQLIDKEFFAILLLLTRNIALGYFLFILYKKALTLAEL